ncbi:hypothetical protein [Chryseobacterium paridis]|uniref:Uncharacterized protein n=1 Tax=Chryseobacterium paridis TaxID=2800328 RepID=A0ABS1FYQ0_9FLAO|nr:hypothetical protein [Chryseobacterium paridis]MBK1897572.1 hypothetical protein [Chryseobacterium paridis]
MSRKVNEIQKVCKELKIDFKVLSKSESINIINKVFDKYKISKKSGHLAIYSDKSFSISTEDNEFTYSINLDDEPVYVFFDQDNYERDQVTLIGNGQKLGMIMENSFGIEYFVTNTDFTYVLSVNWYVIEGIGSVVSWMKNLVREK